MTERKARTGPTLGALIAALALAACEGALGADQRAALPPDPDAPFPLNDARIIARPGPGNLIIEVERTIGEFGNVQLAARDWCGGPARASFLDENERSRFRVFQRYAIRCG